jgi:hypothetical protein
MVSIHDFATLQQPQIKTLPFYISDDGGQALIIFLNIPIYLSNRKCFQTFRQKAYERGKGFSLPAWRPGKAEGYRIIILEGTNMKITGYNIQSQSAHALEQTKQTQESLESWTGARPAAVLQEGEGPPFQLDIGEGKSPEFTGKSTLYTKDIGLGDDAKDQDGDHTLRLLESFIYSLTGKRVKLRDPSADLKGHTDSSTPDAASQQAVSSQGWGIRYDFSQTYAESESVQFSSSGSVTTADGRSITFRMDFAMSRQYYESSSISLRLGDAAKTDPLVIAYGGGAPQLTNAKTSFDLDADGINESISFATGESGFLALDKNGDGQINNGSELFGPQSGDGFSELRAYDLDKNGWIDENDTVFGKLSIWTADESGNKVLFSLGEAGVGAIYLGDTATTFDYKDASGVLRGEMKSTSIFLRENGTAGTIHHIDLAL